MLHEKGRVVAVENNALWIETIQQSVCGSCVAKKGCGQRLLANFGAQPNYLRAILSADSAAKYNVGDNVTIGIAEQAVVKASLLAYLSPLIFLVCFTGAVHFMFENDLFSVIAGITGLMVGAMLVRLYTSHQCGNTDFQPKIIE